MENVTCGRHDPSLPEWETIPQGKERIIREHARTGTRAETQRRMVARRSPFRDRCDEIFLADPHGHWAEVFELEKRAEEPGTIISLDFNSMYPHAILEREWPAPASLKPRQGDFTERILAEDLNHGIFRCSLRIRQGAPHASWFRNHHYLRHTTGGKSHHFLWTHGLEIETLLDALDIQALSPWCEIQTQWGIFGVPTPHPVAPRIRDLLRKREKGNEAEAKWAKAQLVRSCSTQRQRFLGDGALNLAHREAVFGAAQHENLSRYKDTQACGEIWKGPSNRTAYSLFNPVQSFARARLLSLAFLTHIEGGKLLRCHTDGLSALCHNNGHAVAMWEAAKAKFGTETPGGLKAISAEGGFFAGPNLWWTYRQHSEGLEIREHAGTPREKPFQTHVTLKDGTRFDCLRLFEKSKLLRKTRSGWKWMRTEPTDQWKGRETRKNLQKLKVGLFRKFQNDRSLAQEKLEKRKETGQRSGNP